MIEEDFDQLHPSAFIVGVEGAVAVVYYQDERSGLPQAGSTGDAWARVADIVASRRLVRQRLRAAGRRLSVREQRGALLGDGGDGSPDR
jgi:hypothetical protein